MARRIIQGRILRTQLSKWVVSVGNTSYIDIVNWPHVKSGALRAQKHQQNETEPIKRNN